MHPTPSSDDNSIQAGPPIVVSHEHGQRFAAEIRSHVIRTDQPLAAGGEDDAPSPLELFGVALGSCVALYVRKFLLARGITAEGLRVEVSHRTARNPARITSFDVRLILPPDVPSLYRPMLEAVVRVCPAYNTLAQGAAISMAIETQATAAA